MAHSGADDIGITGETAFEGGKGFGDDLSAGLGFENGVAVGGKCIQRVGGMLPYPCGRRRALGHSVRLLGAGAGVVWEGPPLSDAGDKPGGAVSDTLFEGGGGEGLTAAGFAVPRY